MANKSSAFNFNQALKDLEDINRWFQQEDIDLEEGLQKLKEGKALIAGCRARLKEVENEFHEIQADSANDLTPAAATADSENLTESELPF